MFNSALQFTKGPKWLVGLVASILLFATLSQNAQAITPAEIKARGKLIVGIQGEDAPFGFIDSTGQQQGFDKDVADLFGRELGVPVEFIPLAVANRIPALTSGRVDVLFATMAMLPARAKSVQYSKPYAANVLYMVGNKKDSIKSYADLNKFTIGVPSSSVQDAALSKNAPPDTNIRRFADDASTIQALLSGQVAAVGGNMFYLQRIESRQAGTFENKFEFTRLYNGACSRLGEKEINAALNTFIDKIVANGELSKIYAKWLKQPFPTFPASVDEVPFVAN
jgi:polar amino acid transport system substrate-binding protein